jgi:hypothetical protein
MTALTLALLNTTETLANSPILSGSVAVAIVLCITFTSREEKVLRGMNNQTRADIGLSPYVPSWLSA